MGVVSTALVLIWSWSSCKRSKHWQSCIPFHS